MKTTSLLLLSLFICVSASSRSRLFQSPAPQFDAFFTGLLTGLQLNATAGPCASALTAAESDLSAFVYDFAQLVQGNEAAITYFLLDGGDVFTDLQASSAVCDFDGLLSAFSALLTPAGQQQLVFSFTVNINTFLLDFQQLQSCGSDWNNCGFYVGELLRMTLSWGVNAPAPKELKSTETTFFHKVLEGLSAPGNNGECVGDLEGMIVQAKSVMQLASSVFSGEFSNMFPLMSELATLQTELLSYQTVCNLSQLYQILPGLVTVEGLKQLRSNLYENLEGVKSASEVLSRCAIDSATCGFVIGETIRLMLGWGLGN